MSHTHTHLFHKFWLYRHARKISGGRHEQGGSPENDGSRPQTVLTYSALWDDTQGPRGGRSEALTGPAYLMAMSSHFTLYTSASTSYAAWNMYDLSPS